MANFNELLRAWRIQHKLSQEDAATRVGVKRHTWMRWEGGSPIELRYVAPVSRETKIPAAYLRPDIAQTFLPQTEAVQ